MKHKLQLSVSSARILRGVGTTIEIAPRRVIVIGGSSDDAKRLAGDWRRVGNDIRRVMTRSAGSGK